MRTMARIGHVMAILTLTMLAGCRPAPDMRDQRLVDLASESMDRQAEQNQQLARQTQTVLEESQRLAEASKELVTQDSKARQELIAAHESLMSQLNQQQSLIDAGRQQLEQERQELDQKRYREPVIANTIEAMSLLLLCLLPLLVAVYAIRRMTRSELDDAAIAELLVQEFASERPKLLTRSQLPPALGDTRPDASAPESN